MGKLVTEKELVKLRKKHDTRKAFDYFFNNIHPFTKNTVFDIAKLGTCKVYFPITHMTEDVQAALSGELERAYKILTS